MSSDPTIEEIKARLSVVDVVGGYVKLVKAGRSYKGLSPFSKEKTPSFYVSPERGSYYCFSTNQGGDIFTFIEKMEGTTFPETLKLLAERAGVVLPERRERTQGRDDSRLAEAVSRAARFYEAKLREHEAPRAYLARRGVSAESLAAWGIGYAPDGWRTLLEALLAEGFSQKELLEAGLVKEADGKPGTVYDRFRNRVMFPLRDPSGKTVGFTGRTLAADESAKYLNSPETALYKKSRILYGLDLAKQAIRERGFIIVVEGQMDLVMSRQAGFPNTIALSGTAFTEEQLSLIRRYTDNVMLALDSDRAGFAASLKSALLAIRAGLRVKALTLSKGKDPADLILEDPGAYARAVRDAESVIDVALARVLAEAPDRQKAAQAIEGAVLPLVRAVRSPLEQDHFVQRIAERSGLAAEAVRHALSREPLVPSGVPQAEAPIRPDTATPEEFLAATLARHDAHAAEAFARLAEAGITLSEEVPERILFEVDRAYPEGPTEDDIRGMVRSLLKTRLKERIADTTAALKDAEAERDEEGIARLAKEHAELSSRLAELS